jgi:hypothetical protein
VRLGPFDTAATTGLLYQPQMIGGDDCGAIGGIEIRRGNQSAGRKPAPVPFCSPQIPHDLTWARNRATAVKSARLTARVMAWPTYSLYCRNSYPHSAFAKQENNNLELLKTIKTKEIRNTV